MGSVPLITRLNGRQDDAGSETSRYSVRSRRHAGVAMIGKINPLRTLLRESLMVLFWTFGAWSDLEIRSLKKEIG